MSKSLMYGSLVVTTMSVAAIPEKKHISYIDRERELCLPVHPLLEVACADETEKLIDSTSSFSAKLCPPSTSSLEGRTDKNSIFDSTASIACERCVYRTSLLEIACDGSNKPIDSLHSEQKAIIPPLFESSNTVSFLCLPCTSLL
jgi:hypothetical protein